MNELPIDQLTGVLRVAVELAIVSGDRRLAADQIRTSHVDVVESIRGRPEIDAESLGLAGGF